MTEAPLNELIEAVAGGLARPYQFWTLVVVLLALAVGRVVSERVRRRTQVRLDADDGSSGVHVDALRFSIDGVRRLAFPLAAQATLWLGELGLRLAGLLTTASDARLLRLAMTLFAAMAAIRLVVYVLRRAFRNVALIAAWERALALLIWAVFALHLTGWLGAVVEWLEATYLPLGKAKVSLWVVVMGAVSVLSTMLAALWIGSSLEARLMRAQSIDSNLRAVLSRVLRALLLLLAVLMALSLVGIDITVLSVFGGALGVGLGLGLQRIASNYVSGFIILLDRSLRLGDLITVDKHHGTVTEINTRYTVLRAADGTQAIVPNEMLVAHAVTNHSLADKKTRLSLKVGVALDTDVALATRLLLEAVGAQADVLPDPPAAVTALGFHAEGVDLDLAFSTRLEGEPRLALQSAVAVDALQRLRAAGIVLAVPLRPLR